MGRRVMAAGFACLLACGMVPAAEPDFRECDGYGAPNAKSDGMTSTTVLFKTQSIDVRRAGQAQAAAASIESCERALKDPALVPVHWLRRASLLQAKAVHQLAAGQGNAALETLAASDAASPQPAARDFLQSMVLGNRAVRVVILAELGRKAEAAAELHALETARPYALSLQALSHRLGLLLDDSLEGQVASMQRLVPLNPNLSLVIFWMLIEQGRFTEALRASANVSFDMPSSRRGWVLEGSADPEADQIAARADFTGARSYAMQALGDEAGARAQMDQAARELEDAGAPPEGKNGKPPSARALRAFEKRRAQAEAGKRMLNIWTTAMHMRSLAPRANPKEFIDLLTADRNVSGLSIAPDLLLQLTLTAPSDLAERDVLVRQIRGRLAAENLKAGRIPAQRLLDQLPRAEAEVARPRFRRAGDGFWLSDNGFSFEANPDSDAVTVRFAHRVASAAVVEELVMLSAALRARQEGKDLLLLKTRRTLQRTTHLTTYGYGTRTDDIPAGHEAQLSVVFLDSTRLPAAYGDAGPRLLRVTDILGALSDTYTVPEAGDRR